jgi:hypothetical protein
MAAMLPTLEAGVAALRRRRLVQGWIGLAGTHAQVALFGVGVVALFLRVLARWESGEAAQLLAFAGIAGLTALVVARRRLPGAASAVAWLDVRGGARGQVVTERELGASDWSEAARAQLGRALAELPSLEWKRPLRAALPGAAFAALAVWVPIPRAAIGPPPVVAATALEELQEMLETLEETLDLPAEVAEELEARLERIEDEAASGQPASTFEAIDRLGERLAAEAAEALEAARQASQDLASAASDPSLADAQAALESALAGMQEAGLGKDLPEAVQNALAPGSLSLPEGMQLSSAELAALSKELKGVLDQRLERLAAGRLIDPARLKELMLGTGGELVDLSDFEFDPDHVCDEECKKPGGT